MGCRLSCTDKSLKAYETLGSRIGRDAYLDFTGHASSLFIFDALEGPDGCISRGQLQRIDRPSFINLISFQELKSLGKMPSRGNMKCLVPLHSIRFSESFIVFISHNWLSDTKNPWSVGDLRGDKYKAVVDAVGLASAKYAKKMSKCYVYIDYISIASNASILDAMDIAMSLSDWVISITTRFL